MLVSHRKLFIYLKTPKAAGTSVEIFFERYCKPEDQAESEQEARPEQISAEGIVGYRGVGTGGSTWWNHMHPPQVRKLLGEEIWTRYFKFCVIRNPFDQLVSLWWMRGVGDDAAQAQADMAFARTAFCGWVLEQPRLWSARHIYTIDGKLCVDATIRYENLVSDVSKICERLGVPADTDRLGRFKSGLRRRPEGYRAYYSRAARERVEREQAEDLAMFGYQF